MRDAEDALALAMSKKMQEIAEADFLKLLYPPTIIHDEIILDLDGYTTPGSKDIAIPQRHSVLLPLTTHLTKVGETWDPSEDLGLKYCTVYQENSLTAITCHVCYQHHAHILWPEPD